MTNSIRCVARRGRHGIRRTNEVTNAQSAGRLAGFRDHSEDPSRGFVRAELLAGSQQRQPGRIVRAAGITRTRPYRERRKHPHGLLVRETLP
jgi:hypothetical protein